jgi:hypothetical protein
LENIMKKRYAVAALAGLLALAARDAQAQSANQTVTFEVQAINQIAVTGSPSLIITTAVAGDAPTSVTAAGSYAITTNQSNRKITASLNTDMPSGVTLSVALTAPAGASAPASPVVLTTSAQDVVTGVSLLNAPALSITYTLSATSAAGVVPSSSKTVTYTVTAGA